MQGFFGAKYLLHLNHVTPSLSLSPIPPFHAHTLTPFHSRTLTLQSNFCFVCFIFDVFAKESRPPAKTKSLFVFWFLSQTARIGGSGERDPPPPKKKKKYINIYIYIYFLFFGGGAGKFSRGKGQRGRDQR